MISVDISNSVTSIGSYAFQNCVNLKEAILPNSILEIKENSFEGCSSLLSIDMSNCNISSISSDAFAHCEKLTSVFLPTTKSYSIGKRAFAYCAYLHEIDLEGTVSIGDEAFIGCSRISEITIPASCSNIGNGVFDYTGLKRVIINSGDKLTIGHSRIISLGNTITPFPNPSDVDEKRTGFRNGYYYGLFYGLPIEHLVINRDIELSKYYERVIGQSASFYTTVYNDIIYYPPFYGLTKLKSVEIGENVSTICKNKIEAVVNAAPTTMDYTNFGKCNNIETVTSKNPNAPIGGGFTDYVYKNAILNLPNGGKESYNTDEYWKNFSNIQTGIINIRDNIMPIDQENVYDLHGRKLNKLQKGINIVNRKKVLMK